MKYLSSLLFISIFVLAFFLRAKEVLSNNYLFIIDMGRDMMAVRDIVVNHHLTLIGPYTSLGGVFQGPLYYYLLSIPTFLFKGDPLGPLILMLLISLATAFIAFIFLKRHFGSKTAFIGFFLFSVCPEAVAAATYTWNPHPMWLLMVLFVFLLFELCLKNKKANLFLWLTIGLMFHFEAALGFFILITTLAYCLLFLKKELFSKYFLIGLLLLFITFIPQILFEFRHQFLMTKSILNMFSGRGTGLLAGSEAFNFVSLMQNHLMELINNYKSSFPIEKPFTFLPAAIFLTSLLVVFLKKKGAKPNNEKTFYGLYIKFIILFILITSFYLFPIRYWFFTGFQSLHLFFIAIVLSSLFRYKYGKLAVLILIIPMFYYLVLRINVLYFGPTDNGGTAKIKGKTEALDFIYEDAQGKEFGLFIFTPPVSSDPYDYIINWRESKKYNYVPARDKSGTFYLLIEPDPNQPWTYKGWLETIIKTGKIEKTVKLPSGFIIQKRISDL